MTAPTPALVRLARQMGTLTTYRDALGNDRTPTAETLMAVLKTLGVDITSPDQADELLDMRPGRRNAAGGAGDCCVGRRVNDH